MKATRVAWRQAKSRPANIVLRVTCKFRPVSFDSFR